MTRPILASHRWLGIAGTTILPLLLLISLFYTHAGAVSLTPDIQLNGVDAEFTLSSNSTLTATIRLDAGEEVGEEADWWVAAYTPMGWYYYQYPDMWKFGGNSLEDLMPAYQGPLFDLTEPLEVLNITGLPAGAYMVYFGVDMDMNGVLTGWDALYYDWVAVNIIESDGSFQVVDTGQTTCYDDSVSISCPSVGESFYGQDAEILRNPPSHALSADGLTVYDNVTGLTWTKGADWNGDGTVDVNDKFTYEDAQNYVDTLNARNYGGFGDWRVPTIKELYSLIDFRGTDPNPTATDAWGLVPFIDDSVFEFAYGDTASGERIIDSQWVTSTLYVGTVMNNQTAMFGVNFADGRIKGYPTDKTFYARFCRGNSDYGTNDFIDNGDGTVTDSATGLMWSQSDSGEGLSWESALSWVQQKNEENYLGHDDWRLPNAKELQSLVDYTRSPDTTNSAAIDPLFNATEITNEAGEPDFPFYWSSTTFLRFDGSADHAVYVAFGRGLGSMDGINVIDVHGAGCQRSDPKDGDPNDYPTWGFGPQGDVQRVFNYVRLVRDIS